MRSIVHALVLGAAASVPLAGVYSAYPTIDDVRVALLRQIAPCRRAFPLFEID